MSSPERVRSSVKRDIEEDIEVNIDTMGDDDERNDKRKHSSSKSRKPGNGEEADGLDGSGRKRSTYEKHESRKKVAGSSRADSDREDYYEARKESRSKQVKKNPEESALANLSTWYQDGEAENKFEGGVKSGSRGYSRSEESERKKSTTSKHSGSLPHGRNSQSRWDESENVGEADKYVEKPDLRSRKSSDPKPETASAGTDNLELELTDVENLGLDSMSDRGIKSHDGEERRVDSERTRRGRSEVLEEDNKGSLTREERFEEHIQPRNPIQDTVDSNERRDMDSSKARTPEKNLRRQSESDNYEMDYERSTSFRKKEQGKDGNWDDRSKGRDDSWGDRNRDRDNFNDTRKRRQGKDTRDVEKTTFDNNNSSRDWESPKRGGREWVDGDRPHSRFGGRKDGNRTEAVKTSSKYGISSENYDVIEIQTKPFDYAREESRPIELIQQSDTKPASDVEDFAYPKKELQFGEDTKDRSMDDDSRGQKGLLSNRGQSSSCGSLPPQGNRGNRGGRVGRGRPTGRESQPAGVPIPMMGSPFGPLGLPPPGPMQSLPNNMSPAPGPPMSPGVFIPQFQPPLFWPGAGGIDMNMLAVPPGLPPMPPGPLGPRFSPNLGNPPSSGPGRGAPLSMSGPPNFNAIVPGVRPRTNAPTGKAPSRGEQNDYSQNFVDTGTRPQNFIRELELTNVVEDYPKLRELITRKDEIVVNSSFPPMFYKCDLREQVLSPEFFGTKFDVILVDPPWEEYVHRAPGVSDHMDYWTFEEIMNLKIEAIADTPSFIFLWVGDGVGLEQGRQCLKKWGFRRCEDICWVKTNKSNATPGLRHDSHTLFQRSKEHCLMGIKGTVRRSTDGHIIHANIDTDVIIAEEPPYGSTGKPEDMYRIIEHFALGRRRLELFGEDHNIRPGWLTLGKGLSSSNFNSEGYIKNFADKDGKVWMGGRNPPPEAPHLVITTPEIESLRPKSPMKNQQQLQSSASISLTANSTNKSHIINATPNPNQEASSSNNIPSPAPWMEAFKGRENFGMYGFDASSFGPTQGSGEFLDYDRGRNMF